MKKVYATFYCLFFCLSISYAQSIKIDTTGVPNITNPMVVCGGNQTFSIELLNISSSTLTSVYITYNLPTGIYYTSGSLTGSGISEYNITNSNAPVFEIPSLASANVLSFSFSAYSNCTVLNVVDNIDSLKANITLSYVKGSTSFTEFYKSSVITVYEPSLSMQLSNNSVTADIGDTITRTISIVNGGTGFLNNFNFYLVTPSDLNLIELNNGSYTTSNDSSFVFFSATDFTSIGDGDTLFEQNEKIIFTEKVVVTACVNLQSSYDASWGCNNIPCQEINSFSSVSVLGSIPYLTVSSTASLSGCYGNDVPSSQQIKIINTGNGPAVNLEVEVFQANTSVEQTKTYFYSYIDDSSFTYKLGVNGIPIQPIIDSTVLNVNFSCFATTAPKAYVKLQIPYLAVGDTIYIDWNVYTCCLTIDPNNINYGYQRLNGWNYDVLYDNQCETKNYTTGVKSGRVSSSLRFLSQTSNNPADMNEGDIATFNFNAVSYVLLPGETGKWYIAFEFLIPECLKAFDNSIKFVDKNNLEWGADSIINHDSIITAYFSAATKPTNFYTSTATVTSIDIALDCASCTENDAKEVTMNTYYVPSPGCNCESQIGTITALTQTHCEISCDDGGIWTYAYEIYRTSYGLPDNDNNGIPDSSGAVNLDSINIKTVMYHDTLTAYFKATVLTSTNNPFWKYVYAESNFSHDDLVAVDASLRIYDLSANTYYNCTYIPYNSSNGSYTYNLSVDSLKASGCIPLDFYYENGDSIWFNPRYAVINNLYNITTYTTTVDNDFYSSTIPFPDTSQTRYHCDNYSNYYTLAGFSLGNANESSIVTGACDTVTVDQIFNSSIGACCFNFAGGNLFKYEYRPWSYVSYIKLVLPYGYTFLSASYKYSQTAGTSKSTTTTTAMVPDAINGDTIYFDIKKYYKEFSGSSFSISDDGYNAIMSCKIIPTCGLTANVVDSIIWINEFEPANDYLKGYTDIYSSIPGKYYYVNNGDNIISNVPELEIIPTLPIVQGTDLTASWNFTVFNNSIYSEANHVWVSFQSPSSTIQVKYVVNTLSNDTIYPTADIFQLGDFGIASSSNFNTVCNYYTCNDDSMTLFTGWNCNGYPATLSSSSCFSKSVELYLDPQPSKIDLEITQSPTHIDLCDTAIYEAKISSVQLGALQNIIVTAQIPLGMHLYENTSELLYPKSGSYFIISDPDSIGNNTFQWNIDANSLLIDSNGLLGINDTSLNSFYIQFGITTNCDFISGYDIELAASGEYACGPITSLSTHASLPLDINGSAEPQYTAIDFSIDHTTLCDTAIKCQVSIVNLGPDSMLASNHFVIQIPIGYQYVSGSFIDVLNSSTMTGPSYDSLNGNIVLDWSLPVQLDLGDSAQFNFYITKDSSFNCGTHMLDMYTAYSGNAFCKATGDSCEIYFLSATSTYSIIDDELSLDLLSFSSQSSVYSSNQENLIFNASLENTGSTTFVDSLYMNLYFDADNNGVYSPGDYYLGNVSTYDSIVPNVLYFFKDSLLVPTGFSCAIIAIVNTTGPESMCSCSSTEIVSNSPPNYITQLNDTSMCAGSNTLIGIAPITNMNYSWTPSFGLSNSNNSQTYVNLQDSSIAYTIEYVLTSSNILGGCKQSDSIQVSVLPSPISSIGASTSFICYYDTITISYTGTQASNYTYNWDFGSGITISGSGQGPYQAIFPQNGISMVTLEISNGSCSDIDSISISTGTISTVFASNDTSICTNDMANLSVDSNYTSYLWSTGDTSSSILVASGGLYWVKITNNNCSATDSVIVSLLSLPSSGLNSSDSLHGCSNELTIGPLNPSYSYVWSNGSTADSINVNGSGYYSVTVNNGKCSNTDSIYVDFSSSLTSPLDSSSKEFFICSGETVELTINNALLHALWSTGDTTESIKVSQEGVYWVQMSNQYCSASDTLSVENVSDDNLKIANVFTPNNDGYNEYFNIAIDNVDRFHIDIFNRWGKKVFESDDYQFKWYGDNNGKKPVTDNYYWIMSYHTACKPGEELSIKTGFVELIMEK